MKNLSPHLITLAICVALLALAGCERNPADDMPPQQNTATPGTQEADQERQNTNTTGDLQPGGAMQAPSQAEQGTGTQGTGTTTGTQGTAMQGTGTQGTGTTTGTQGTAMQGTGTQSTGTQGSTAEQQNENADRAQDKTQAAGAQDELGVRPRRSRSGEPRATADERRGDTTAPQPQQPGPSQTTP